MLEFAGEPVIDRSEANLRDVSEFTPSLGQYVGAAWSGGMAGNPVTGRLNQISTLRSLDVGPTYYTTETGEQQIATTGLDPADPRARRLSLDEANEKGAELGLRFSDAPTQGQFDYLADLKRQQNAQAETLSHASTFSVRNALGLTAELAASAIDPLNIAAAFVPVVGEARYARLVGALGRPVARLAKGAAEGGVGTALITPALYYGAHEVHQDYGFADALRDIVVGAGLGSGLHWAGGTIKDVATGKMRADIADLYRRIDPGERWAEAMRRTDRREGARVSEGENASRHDQLDPKQKAQVINAAVKAVENDQMPKIDALFASEPKLRDMAIPDRRFPATVKLRSDLTAEDYVTGGRGASIIDMAIARSLGAAKQPATPQGLFASFAKRFKALASNFKLETVAPGEFFQRAGAALEHPDQRAVIEPGTKIILTTEGATLGAVRHEIERALDDVQKIQGDARGGYRYRKNDLDLINAHRAAMAELVDEFPDRLQGRQANQQEAVDAFSKQDEPILNYRGKEASDAATELVNRDKDQKLERMIADEEIGAIEDIVSNIQGNARDLGIMDKVIPAEERAILEEAAARQSKAGAVRDLFSLAGEALDTGVVGKSLSETEILLKAGHEKLAEIVRGDKTTAEVIAEGTPTPLETLREAGEEPDLWGDLAEDALAILDGEKIHDKRDLIDAESRLVREEHNALEVDKKTRDLFSNVERTEFDEANRERALREGNAAPPSSERGGAGAGGEGQAAATGLQAAALGRDGEAARGAGAAAEREGASPGGERSAPDTAVSYGASTIIRRVITPDSSIEISVEPKIVELADLIHAEGDLQVRDRSRKESAIEARNRATRLDPEQLLPGRVADSGAPIVYPNGDGTYTILSGNGRTLSLRHVYGDPTMGSIATRYRERLGPAADGYRQPVLVSSITDQLSHEAQVQFAERANRSRIATMSVTERAQRDADVAGADIMTMYQGGDFTARDNQPFVRAFMLKAVTDAERGEMSKNGQLTKSGVDRLTGAVLAAAYDDAGVLSLMLESTDSNIKSIASAFRDVAPSFVKLRGEIAQGLVREEMDITAFMMEAARFVQKAREDGIKIADALAQIDALRPMNPLVDRLIRYFYNPQLTRANSALRIAGILKRIADTAREKRLGGFLEDTTSVGDVLSAAERGIANETDEAAIALADEDGGRGYDSGRQEAPQPAPAEPGPVPGERGAGGSQEATDRPAAQAEPVAGLKAQLEALTVPAIRERAKAEGVAIKGRKKSDIIDSYVKASKGAAPKPPITNEQLQRAAGWQKSLEYLNLAEEDAAKLEHRYPRERRTIIQMVRDIGGIREAIVTRNFDKADRLMQGLVADAADLSQREPNANLATQWVRQAAHERGLQPAPKTEIVGQTTSGEVRTAFYDFLEGSEPVRGAGTLAKKLGIDEETAYRLLDDAEARGWLKLKDNGTYIRVPADRRPLRPDFEQEFSDVGANQLPPEAGAAVGSRSQAGAEGTSRLSAEPGRAAPGLREKLSGTERFDAPGFTGVVTATPDVRGRPARIYRLYPEGVKVERNKAPLKSLGEPLIAARVAQHADGRWEVIFVDARPEAQGQRISQKLYDAMETDLGQKMRPSGVLTEEGFSRIWLKRDPEAVKYHRFIQSEDVYLSPRQMVENLDHIERALESKGLAPEARVDNELRRAEIRQALDALPPEAKTPEALAESFSDAPRGWGRVEPDFEAQLQSAMTIQRAIGTAMHRLPEGVRVEVVDAIQFGSGTASGSTLSRLLPRSGLLEMMIRIARTTGDAVNTFNHEIFHTMRLARVINRFEWKVIRDEAAKAGGISPERLQRYKPYFAQRAERLDLHPDLDRHFIDDKLVEEWAATKFGEWISKRASERETFLGRIFGRIKDFIDDLRQSFTNLGRLAQGMETKPSLDQVFRSIEDGSMAKRYRDWGLGRAGADNPLSVNRQAGNEFAAFLNQDMRKIASDSSEAEGRAVETALANLAPCASHHL